MNSRAVLFGIVGMVAGLIAGVFADRQLGSGHSIARRAAAPDQTDAASALPQSSSKPARDADTATTTTKAGRLTLDELPAAIDTVLNEPG